jgi:transcriptional regulator with XRE-family HTH domain
MTQADLADRVGLGRTSITNLENGEQNPPLSVLPLLARALGVEPDRLVAEALGDVTDGSGPLATVTDVKLRHWADRLIARSIADSESPSRPTRPGRSVEEHTRGDRP